jgi:hypothetical protein
MKQERVKAEVKNESMQLPT